MLPEKAHELARSLIHAEREGRIANLDMEVTAIYSEMIKSGALHSTTTVQLIGKLCARELAVRARFIETHLFRVVSETLTELPTDLGEGLKQEGKLYIHEDALTLRNHAQEKANSAYPGQSILARDQVESEESRAIQRFLASVGFFVARLEARAGRPAAASSATINIHGPVGAVQTGAGAVANIAQGLTRDDLEKLRRVLEDLAVHLDDFGELSDARRAELKEVIGEAAKETSASAPNSTKLGGALMAIASTVQGVASGQGAYLALRDMLMLLGFPMP